MSEAGRKGPGREAMSPEAIEVAHRHARWMNMRVAGKTYREIAEAEGVNPNAVWEACSRRLKSVIAEPATELIQLELQRLDTLQTVAWRHAVEAPDEETQLEWVEQARKILADRRKMLGMEAPKRLEISDAAGDDKSERARSVLLSPTGAFREVLMLALMNPGPEWQAMLSEAGYRKVQVLETSGESRERPRLNAIIDEMLGGTE